MRTPRRVVIGTGDTGETTEERLAQYARRLRDAGWEVIWAGTGVSPEQLAAIVVAEDARTFVVADEVEVKLVREGLAAHGTDDVEGLSGQIPSSPGRGPGDDGHDNRR